MDIKDKLRAVAGDIHNTLTNDCGLGGVDGHDLNMSENEAGDAFYFDLYENVDAPNPGGRITRPLGHITYRVTVKATWQPFDD